MNVTHDHFVPYMHGGDSRKRLIIGGVAVMFLISIVFWIVTLTSNDTSTAALAAVAQESSSNTAQVAGAVSESSASEDILAVAATTELTALSAQTTLGSVAVGTTTQTEDFDISSVESALQSAEISGTLSETATTILNNVLTTALDDVVTLEATLSNDNQLKSQIAAIRVSYAQLLNTLEEM